MNANTQTVAPPRQMHLGLFNQPLGRHVAAWRRPEFNGSPVDIDYIVRIAQIAERGKFDFFFLADNVVGPSPDSSQRAGNLEPLTTLAAVAMQTRHIGVAGTASTTFSEPYNTARFFASLDHISHGRAAWNVVTSTWNAAARNFGAERLPDHAERYGRAQEFVSVVRDLWDSWADDAVAFDKESGDYIRPGKIRELNHVGKHFSVAGALNIPRPPQGHLVIIQAGASEDGQNLAAEIADIVFTAQDNIDDARSFSEGLRERARAAGRNSLPLILGGVLPIVAETREEAQAILARLEENSDVTQGLAQLSQRWGFDLAAYPLDEPPPPAVYDRNAHSDGHSRRKLFEARARREGLTLRQLAQVAIASRGHRLVVGSHIDIADDFEEWFTSRAVDGFNIIPPIAPESVEDFVRLVVPELQKRKLFRTEYSGTTLRDHLGLNRPERLSF